jgi:hypothetical protein
MTSDRSNSLQMETKKISRIVRALQYGSTRSATSGEGHVSVGFQDLRSYPAVRKFHIIMDAGNYYAYVEV